MAKSQKQTLNDLIDKFIPEIKAAFESAIADVVDRAILADVIKAIQDGDAIGALRALGLTDAALRPIQQQIEAAFEAGGITTAASFPNHLNTPVGRAVFRFDVRNSRAEKWLRDQSSTLVTRITSDQLEAIQDTLALGVQAGRGPRDIALDIVGRVDPVTRRRTGGIVGLNGPQTRAVINARKDLDALDANYFTRKMRDKRFDGIVQRAIDSGKPLDPETVNKLTGRYSDNLLKLRGDTIARDQTLTALNRSEFETMQQAADIGAIKQQNTVRIWDSAGDRRVRDSHKEMDGQTVGMDEPFITPDGAKLMFPGDYSLGAGPEETINCRCRVRLKIDFLADLAPASEAEILANGGTGVKIKAPVKPKKEKVESPVERAKNIDREMRAYVLSEGRKTNTEHLTAYDYKTGEQIAKNTSNQKSFVAFTPELIGKLENPNSEMILHHNHPSGSSFSHQDLNMLDQYQGMKGMHAHGHDGSTYYAERGRWSLTKDKYDDAYKSTVSVLNKYIELNQDDKKNATLVALAMHSHVIMLQLEQRKIFKYMYELTPERQAMFEKIKPLLFRIGL